MICELTVNEDNGRGQKNDKHSQISAPFGGGSGGGTQHGSKGILSKRKSHVWLEIFSFTFIQQSIQVTTGPDYGRQQPEFFGPKFHSNGCSIQ